MTINKTFHRYMDFFCKTQLNDHSGINTIHGNVMKAKWRSKVLTILQPMVALIIMQTCLKLL